MAVNTCAEFCCASDRDCADDRIQRGRPMRDSTVQLGGSLAGKLSSRLSSMSRSDRAWLPRPSRDGCPDCDRAGVGSDGGICVGGQTLACTACAQIDDRRGGVHFCAWRGDQSRRLVKRRQGIAFAKFLLEVELRNAAVKNQHDRGRL
jgi:hypothetical protein